ncbi:MAG: hypothetical protein RR242_06635 [Clostridium sp.]
MLTMITCFATLISTTAFLLLWFRMVYREMIAKKIMVQSAKLQLDACHKKYKQAKGYSDRQSAKTVLNRSKDIYLQATGLYNTEFKKMKNHIPGLLMGFRQLKEEK